MKLDIKSFVRGLAVRGIVMIVLWASVLQMAAALNENQQIKAGDGEGHPASEFCPLIGDERVTSVLRPIRQKFGIPAMAAALVTSDGIQFVGAVGVRKRDTQIPVTLNDQWHLGSNGKAITSTLLARLIEQGRLKWDATLVEIFPELAPQMHADFRSVTLLQLLSHRAGLPPNLDLSHYRGEDVLALRLRAVREELSKKPRHPPGSVFEYSNLGYIVAGAIAERVTRQSWEQAIRSELFEPLQMTAAGFGGTGNPGEIDQPWPHTADGKPTSKNGAAMDNPLVMGPAGRVHCPIQCWAKFIQDQLRGARGQPALLKLQSYQKLHTPPFGGDYALGWGTVRRDWGGGKVLHHAGDNTMNYANVWMAPQKNFAILVCVNQSGDTAFQASDEAVAALVKLHSE